MSKQSVNLKYDNENDVLYLSIGMPRPSYGEPILNDEGIIARYDMDTDELTGITIIDFKIRLENKEQSSKQVCANIDPSFASFISL